MLFSIVIFFFACLCTSVATTLTLCFVNTMLCADWLVSITYCIFWDLIGSDKLSYILKIGQLAYLERKILSETIQINC